MYVNLDISLAPKIQHPPPWKECLYLWQVCHLQHTGPPAPGCRRKFLAGFPSTLILCWSYTHWDFLDCHQMLLNALHWPKLAQISACAWKMLNQAVAGCASWKAAHLTSSAHHLAFRLCYFEEFLFSQNAPCVEPLTQKFVPCTGNLLPYWVNFYHDENHSWLSHKARIQPCTLLQGLGTPHLLSSCLWPSFKHLNSASGSGE